MKQNDIIPIIQDNNISEYYSLKNLGVEGYAFPYQEALKIVHICKLLAGQLQKSVDALGGGLTKYIAQAVYEERKISHSSHL